MLVLWKLGLASPAEDRHTKRKDDDAWWGPDRRLGLRKPVYENPSE
jgi:hypothetical protein